MKPMHCSEDSMKPQKNKNAVVKHRASTDPECHLNGAQMATAGTCGGSIYEAVQNSDRGQEYHSPCPYLHQLPAVSPHL